MKYSIIIQKKAQKFIRKQSQPNRERLLTFFSKKSPTLEVGDFLLKKVKQLLHSRNSCINGYMYYLNSSASNNSGSYFSYHSVRLFRFYAVNETGSTIYTFYIPVCRLVRNNSLYLQDDGYLYSVSDFVRYHVYQGKDTVSCSGYKNPFYSFIRCSVWDTVFNDDGSSRKLTDEEWHYMFLKFLYNYSENSDKKITFYNGVSKSQSLSFYNFEPVTDWIINTDYDNFAFEAPPTYSLSAEEAAVSKQGYDPNEVFNKYSHTYKEEQGELEDDLIVLGAQVNALGEAVGQLSGSLKSEQILGQTLDLDQIEEPTEVQTQGQTVVPGTSTDYSGFFNKILNWFDGYFDKLSAVFTTLLTTVLNSVMHPIQSSLGLIQDRLPHADMENTWYDKVLSTLLNIGLWDVGSALSSLGSSFGSIEAWDTEEGILGKLKQEQGSIKDTLKGWDTSLKQLPEKIVALPATLLSGLKSVFIPSTDNFIDITENAMVQYFPVKSLPEFAEVEIPDLYGPVPDLFGINNNTVQRVKYVDFSFLRDHIDTWRGWLQGAIILCYLIHIYYIVKMIFDKGNGVYLGDLFGNVKDTVNDWRK